MNTQINNAFAALNEKMINSDQEFATLKVEGTRAAVAKMEAGFKTGEPEFMNLTSGYGRFDASAAKILHYGSKAMMNLLDGRGLAGALEMMKNNTLALIAKRDTQIIKALNKAGITEIPEFTLTECSDGVEGSFNVAGHVVTIRTILAGGYNIQRLHTRTLVKVN